MTNEVVSGSTMGLTDFLIRACDGTQAEAEAMRAIQAEAFGLAPALSVEEIRQTLRRPAGHAWVAEQRQDGAIVGFVAAFETRSLSGHRLEIDLLAVRPPFRGRGLGQELVRAATDQAGKVGARAARALIRVGNRPSERAFSAAGYRPLPHAVELVTLAAEDRPCVPVGNDLTVRALQCQDLPRLAERWPDVVSDPDVLTDLPGWAAFVVWDGAEPVGWAELLEVHTVCYHGVWVETLRADEDDGSILALLGWQVSQWARGLGATTTGALIDVARERARGTLHRAGWRSIGRYRTFWRGDGLG